MNFYEHIEEYLEGQLSGKALEAFESAIAEDEGLRHAVDNYPEAKSLAKGLLEIDVMESIKGLNIDTGSSTSEESKKDIGWPMWVLGALVLIGLGMSLWRFMKETPTIVETDTEILYAQLYEEPMWPIERSGNTSFESKGAEAYLNGDIESAEVYLIDSIENKELGKYWLVEMYLKEGQLEKASKALASIKGNSNISENRLVYLKIMLELKKGDLEEARKNINNLNQSDYKLLYDQLSQ